MKIILSSTFLFAFLFLQIKVTAQNVVAHWDFSASNNNIIPDLTGSHPAVISNNSEAEFFISPDGRAIYINGSSTIIQAAHAEDLSLVDSFTIKCIIKPGNFDTYRTILFKGDRKSVPNLVNYFLAIRYGQVSFMTKLPDDNWANWSSGSVLQLNEWAFIVLSYKNGKVKLWVNGKLCTVGQPTPPAGGKLITNTFPLSIGHARDITGMPGYPFIGLLDDIKIIKGAVDSIPQTEINDWNNLLVSFVQREKDEKINLINSKIESYRARFSITASDINTIKDKLANIATLPSDQFDTALAALEIELNQLFFRSYFKKYCSNPDGFVVAPLITAERVDKRPDFITLMPSGRDSIKLQSAGNETEGVQVLMVANPDKDVTGIQIKVSDLVRTSGYGSIKSDQISIGRIRDIITSPPDIAVDFSGPIPDMIEDDVLPQLMPKASFTPVYFRIYVPDRTPAGIYNGKITFSGNGMKDSLNIQLRVFNFSLPKRLSFKVAFSFYENYYEDWYSWRPLTETQKMYIYNFLLKYGISPHNIYTATGTYPEQKYLEALKDRINFFTFSGSSPSTQVSESNLQIQVSQKEAVYNQIKLMGLEKYAYFYSYDELSVNRSLIPAAQQMLPALRTKIPDLKAMQSSFPDDEIKSLFIFCFPLLHFFGDSAQLKILKDLKKQGNEIWWYAADSPSKPYPNFFLDYPVFDSRIISLLSYMYNIDGVQYWSINREWSTNLDLISWPDDNWKPYIISVITNQRIYKNGMGNLIYPGPSGRIYPSLRLENLRDGAEDYEYLAILKKSIDALDSSDYSNKQILLDNARKLLQVPSSVALAVNNYSPDPDNLLKYRENIAEMIEAINKVTFTGIAGISEPDRISALSYPNPFKEKTTIKYNLQSSGRVNISIFNVMGQLVKTLVDETQNEGIYQVECSASNLDKGNLINGVFFCRISVNGSAKTVKLIVMP